MMWKRTIAGAIAVATTISCLVLMAVPAQADSRWKQCVPVQAAITGASIKGTLCIGNGEFRVAGWVKDTASDDRHAAFRIRVVEHMAPGYDQTHTSNAETTARRPAGETVHFDHTYVGSLKALKAQPCVRLPQRCDSRWHG